jgi:hypothetical protein
MLEWLTQDQWTKGAHARDASGSNLQDDIDELLSPNDPKAVAWDLYGALRISYVGHDEFYAAIDELKSVYKMLFRSKWDAVANLDYYKKDGKLIYTEPLLSRLNDELDTYRDVERLLLYAK